MTADGFELQFATNFLGPFALTMRLLPLVLRGNESRVATMSSAAAVQGRLRFEDLQSIRRYSPFGAYAASKLAHLVMAKHLARVSAARGWALRSAAAHPGSTGTNLASGRDLGRRRPRRGWFNWRGLFPKMDVEPAPPSALAP